MLAILAPVVVFGLVIFVHELGHFLAAKSVGVYTPRFSIGFGPALWRRRAGETEYVLAAFPLGGFVRMASRHDEATAFLEGGSEEATKREADDPNFDPNAMIPFGPKPVPEDRWFESKPLWARLYILVAGVTMNFALGLVIAIGLAAHFGKPVYPMRRVGAVRPVDSQPLLAAIQPGDSILRVNGAAVRTWTDVITDIARSRDSIRIETNRATVSISLGQAGGPTAVAVAEALDFELPPVVGDLAPGEPAVKAGLQTGDTVLALDGRRIATWSQMVVVVAGATGRPVQFDVSRKGSRVSLSITPRAMEGIDPATGARTKVGKIGAYAVDITVREPVSAFEAVAIGTRTTLFMGTTIIGTVRDLVTRKVGTDQVGGPIAIARASVQAARNGIENLLYLIALLSVNVAILNLLPIPILDGGQIMINVLESARGTPFSLRTREYVLRGGLMFILLLFVLVMFKDVRDWIR